MNLRGRMAIFMGETYDIITMEFVGCVFFTQHLHDEALETTRFTSEHGFVPSTKPL